MAASHRRAKVAPALQAFGKQLRRYRDEADLTQENIADRVGLTTSFVGQVELGKKKCRRSFAEVVDRELKLGGRFVNLWDDLVDGSAFPVWFDWPVIEDEATELTSWSSSIIHGLLQTPAYASVILHGKQDQIEARLGRQAILTRDDPPPPDCLFLLDEVALLKPAGSPQIMAEQLEHLITLMRGGLKLQIVPMRADHIGNATSFNLAVLEDLTELVYFETAARGFTVEDAEDVKEAHKALKEISSLALPVNQSVEFIRKIMEEKWQ